MDNNLNKVFEKWDEFKKTNTKQDMPERKADVLALYERVRLELMDEAVFTLDDQGLSCTITIAAESFVASDDFPALRDLICNANTFRAYIREAQVILDLCFSFQNWNSNT